MTTSNCFHNFHAKIPAYLKMLISTFKEQPFTKLCNKMTFVEKNLFNFSTLMILKLTETKWKHNQPKWSISE